MRNQQMHGKTGKKIMKKVRNGTWVAVAVLGLISLPAGTASAQENETPVKAVISVNDTMKKADVVWVANTVDQVKDEVAVQSEEKEQAPLTDYTIIWGDTLSAIALATDSTVDELVDLNSIENPDLIYAGDVLTLADGSVVEVVKDQPSDAKEEVKEDAKEDTAKTVVEDKKEDVKEDTAKPVAVDVKDEAKEDTKKEDVTSDKTSDKETSDDTDTNKGDSDKGNTSTDKGDSDKGYSNNGNTNTEKPNTGNTNPGGVVNPPTNNGGGTVNDGDDKEDEVDKDEDNGEDVGNGGEDTDTGEDNGEDVDNGGEDTDTGEDNGDTDGDNGGEDSGNGGDTELPEDEVTPVEPGKDPEVDESEQVPTDPETPEEPEVPGDIEKPVEPTEPPVEDVTPPVEVPGETPEEPEEGEEVPETPVITTSNKTVKEQLGYNSIRRANPDLAVGEERVVQNGSYGVKETVYKITYKDEVEISKELVSEGVTVQPVDHIVEYGTKVQTPIITTSNKTVKEQLGYNSIRRANPDLAVGEERVVQEGSYGQKETIYKLTYEDGVLINTELVSENVTAQPVDHIIEYGTKVTPDITTKTETKKESVDFKEVRRDNPDLPVGQERVVQEGSKGEKVIEYLVTYEDGVEISREKVGETISTKPVDRIVEVGTKEEKPELNRVEEVLSKSDDEAYNLAKNMAWEDTFEYQSLTQEELQELSNSIDYGKLNTEFGKLINNHRASLGLDTLEQSKDFASGTQQIAEELADYGYIAPDGHPGHTLPNGNKTDSVFSEDLLDIGRGENISFRYNENNPYQITSEKYLAEVFFNNWMNSAGHKANMEQDYYAGFTISVVPVVNGNTKVGEKDANGNYVITGNADKGVGIGVVAVLTLVIGELD